MSHKTRKALATLLAASIALCAGCDDDDGARPDANVPAGDGASPTPDGLLPTPDGPTPPMDAGPAADGPPPVVCPSSPPADGASCAGFDSCSYLRCAAEGQVVAICSAGKSTVTITPCEPFDCLGEQCEADQICQDQSGGAQIGVCVANPCGDGPLSCECLATICGPSPDCMVTGQRTFRCRAPCGDCP